MNVKKILVTGGVGYIGSHTVVALQEAGYEVVIVDNLSNSKEFILDRIVALTGKRPIFYCVDLCDKMALQKLFKTEGQFDAVIHFAAFKAVGESVTQPLKYFKNNLESLLNLLACMEDHNCGHLVFSSSATVYGDPLELPLKETTQLQKALSPYGITKQMGEDIIEKMAQAGKLKAIALRYFNPVGAHVSGLIGELPLGVPNNLMPFVTQTAMGKQKRLTVYGNNYETSDGSCVRDYIHVVDLANAHVKSCELLLANRIDSPYEVFNIGTGIGYSVLDVIDTFEKENKVKLNYTIGERRVGDAPAIFADATKAKKILKWKAEKKLKDMVVDAWRWEKQLNQNDKG